MLTTETQVWPYSPWSPVSISDLSGSTTRLLLYVIVFTGAMQRVLCTIFSRAGQQLVKIWSNLDLLDTATYYFHQQN